MNDERRIATVLTHRVAAPQHTIPRPKAPLRPPPTGGRAKSILSGPVSQSPPLRSHVSHSWIGLAASPSDEEGQANNPHRITNIDDTVIVVCIMLSESSCSLDPSYRACR
jgi:hypothetical protein